MNLIFTTVLLVILSIGAFAQTEKLPEILRPDAFSESEALRMGAKVFKLVPNGMFKDPDPDTFKDKDNPIGIRGGGHVYSFLNESHSFNKYPQISAESVRGEIEINGYGRGVFTGLGSRDLADIDASLPEAGYCFSYKLPKLRKDLIEQDKVLDAVRSGPLMHWEHGSLSVGNTYIVRTIELERFDAVFAIQILRKDLDGSITIAWKKLAEFSIPFVLNMPDKELQEKVDAVIAEEGLVGVRIIVKDNHLHHLGPNYNDSYKVERYLTERGIPYRGSGGDLPK